jgi:hypothetical protein
MTADAPRAPASDDHQSDKEATMTDNIINLSTNKPLTAGDKVLIYELVVFRGFQQRRVARLFDVDQDCIAEAVAEIERGKSPSDNEPF